MELIKSLIWIVVGTIAFLGGLTFGVAAIYEITQGGRPPGILGMALFHRDRDREFDVSWSRTRWRRNGCQVLALAIGLIVLALWALTKTR